MYCNLNVCLVNNSMGSFINTLLQMIIYYEKITKDEIQTTCLSKSFYLIKIYNYYFYIVYLDVANINKVKYQ